MTVTFSILVLASALIAVRAEHKGFRRQVYVFKPLTLVLVVLVALQGAHKMSGTYMALVVAGLACSLAGDVLLMLPRERFVAGLVSFLFAHLFYIAAFTLGGARVNGWALAALVLYGALMLGLLWARLGGLKAPVAVYVAVILLMALQASGRWLAGGSHGAPLAALGSWLFLVSDSALAVNRFRGEFRGAKILTLSTYFVAQWLIALST